MFGNPSQLMSLMSSDDGIKNLLLEDHGDFSFAEVIADAVNVQRLDNKRLAEAVGEEMEVKRMTPERAAEILQTSLRENPAALVEVFNDLEDERAVILESLLEEEEYEEYIRQKQSSLYTAEE